MLEQEENLVLNCSHFVAGRANPMLGSLPVKLVGHWLSVEAEQMKAIIRRLFRKPPNFYLRNYLYVPPVKERLIRTRVPGSVAEERRTRHDRSGHDRREGSMVTRWNPNKVVTSEREDLPFAEDTVLCYP